jgi:hypothetical protein
MINDQQVRRLKRMLSEGKNYMKVLLGQEWMKRQPENTEIL